MQFTKEQLIEWAQTHKKRAEEYLVAVPNDEYGLKDLALAEIALAALTAEPEVQPVQVPEWTNEQCLEFLSIAFRHAEINGDLQLDDIRLGVKMVNGSRPAMLQGAEPLTTAYKLSFEQWLSQQTGTIDVECGCVMTEVFFHWLRVAYEAGNSPVIPDGWQLVPKQITLEMECALSRADSYEIGWRWALAAAPKQEVK